MKPQAGVWLIWFAAQRTSSKSHSMAPTAVVQGFGNVGSITALELHNMGAKVIAVSDHMGALYRPQGLDIPQLVGHAASQGSLDGYSSELALDPGELLTIPCDVLVPAALERVIDAEIASRKAIRRRSSSSPIFSATRAVSWSATLNGCRTSNDCSGRRRKSRVGYQLLDRAFERVLARSKRENLFNRTAAMAIGVERVRGAKETRGLFPSSVISLNVFVVSSICRADDRPDFLHRRPRWVAAEVHAAAPFY